MNSTSTDEKKRPGKTALPALAPPPAAGPDELGQVRDLLFGAQMRSYDARLQTLEGQTQAENADLRADLIKRLASLEDYVKGEMNALSERVKIEQEERYRAVKQVTKELREGIDGLDKRLLSGVAQLESELHKLRDQVLQFSQSVRDEIRAAAQEPAAAQPH